MEADIRAAVTAHLPEWKRLFKKFTRINRDLIQEAIKLAYPGEENAEFVRHALFIWDRKIKVRSALDLHSLLSFVPLLF
jgi:hypothetical protein